jgi:HdeA/HdeB family
MCPKPIVTGLVLSSIVCATAPAQAQVIVDVSKITCDQYVHAKITTPNLIAAWLSGYYNAKRNNTIIDLRGGPGCLNRFSASISGASAGVRLPSGVAAG